jgi:hypothetical protein
MDVREMLARGEFNQMSQSHQSDGSVIVKLTKRGNPHVYTLAVRDLYKPTEEVLWEEVDGVRQPK